MNPKPNKIRYASLSKREAYLLLLYSFKGGKNEFILAPPSVFPSFILYIIYYMVFLFVRSMSNLTRIVSLPIRSISHQGTTIRFFAESEASNPLPGRTIERISPVQELNSRSQTQPSKLPSRMLMTSLFRNSENVVIADIRAVCISIRRCLRL